MKFITKKNIIILGAICALGFVVSFYAFTVICGESLGCSYTMATIAGFCSVIFISLIPGYIIFPLELSVFERWKRFAIWAAPITVIFSTLISFLFRSSPELDFGRTWLLLVYSVYFLASFIVIFREALQQGESYSFFNRRNIAAGALSTIAVSLLFWILYSTGLTFDTYYVGDTGEVTTSTFVVLLFVFLIPILFMDIKHGRKSGLSAFIFGLLFFILAAISFIVATFELNFL